jgi:diguanylate cyclase (GGDEF)-like protein
MTTQMLRAKTKIFTVSVIIVAMMTVLFMLYMYNVQKKLYMENVNEKLKMAAQSGEIFLGDDFVDRYDRNHPITANTHFELLKKLSTFAQNNGIEYIYFMVKEGDTVYIVLSSATADEIKNRTYDQFYTAYEGSEAIESGFTHKHAFYEEATDKYGTFRSYCEINRSDKGKYYLIGTDIKIESIEESLKRLMNQNTLFFITILALVSLMAILRYLELMHYNAKLLHLSITDKLTGLYNRQKTDMVLVEEQKKIVRYEDYRCSMMMIDIDKFKNVNDTYGHDTGDQALQQLASIMTNTLRDTDVVGRWGGEEFIIILPHTPLEEALKAAEKLRIKVEEYFLRFVTPITISIGVGKLQSGKTIHETTKEVDEALFWAKKKGRNRVESE